MNVAVSLLASKAQDVEAFGWNNLAVAVQTSVTRVPVPQPWARVSGLAFGACDLAASRLLLADGALLGRGLAAEADDGVVVVAVGLGSVAASGVVAAACCCVIPWPSSFAARFCFAARSCWRRRW
jgi:hypothetical protein